MSKSDIVINGKHFTHDQIISNSFDTSTAFERSTLSFCHDWLTGKKHFKLQTSGSTGTPKEIIFTRDQMIASASMTQAALGLKEGDTALVCLDTKYIAGQMMLVRSFVVRMNIIATEPTSNPFTSIDTNQKIDFTALVPYQLQNIVSTNPEYLNKVRVAIIGGAPVDSSLKNKLKGLRCEVYATYGMTETLSHIGLMRLNNSNSDDYYTTLPGVVIEKDRRGCLLIETRFLSESVITNDLVEIKEPNQFKWLGRWDNIINSGGVKVIPEKIEKQLEEIFRVCDIHSRFFIAGFPDVNLGQKVGLVIESSPFEEEALLQLQSKMKAELSRYEVPREVMFIKSFEETETGKINRSKTIHLFPA
ncbi:MAG TPA: AMP-binding protein [Cyclobacteriaceae bacterium]|nr:AMP-binding protein [Cyclobacteriaceae bacterium]